MSREKCCVHAAETSLPPHFSGAYFPVEKPPQPTHSAPASSCGIFLRPRAVADALRGFGLTLAGWERGAALGSLGFGT